MKCINKTEYDCFYLDKNNVDEFLMWIDEHFPDNYCYKIYDKFITIQFGHIIFDDGLDDLQCYYNRWYVIKDMNLFSYSSELFLKKYNLIVI